MAVSSALLTQIEGATYVRAAILVAVGAALWGINWLVPRRQAAGASAPPAT